MVVILVVALLLPRDQRSLLPLALTWAFLAAPGAMDEAAAVAERLGGSQFVEALRAHGYSGFRIFIVHVVGYNLRPVVVRQGAETLMNVVFLEIALSYLALDGSQPSFTHADSLMSWADLLKLGYPSLIPSLDYPSGHALVLGLALLGLVATMSIAIGRAARAR
jgi:ABC-type dipeptide/oligopeptide/nickel transport system permease subunit